MKFGKLKNIEEFGRFKGIEEFGKSENINQFGKLKDNQEFDVQWLQSLENEQCLEIICIGSPWSCFLFSSKDVFSFLLGGLDQYSYNCKTTLQNIWNKSDLYVIVWILTCALCPITRISSFTLTLIRTNIVGAISISMTNWRTTMTFIDICNKVNTNCYQKR